ncbi:hypothetical protein MUO65_06235 [bacterium]|nr:hypothetical protein [bacterium]
MIDIPNLAMALVIGLFTSGVYWFTQRKQLTSAQKERIKRAVEKIESTILREMVRDNRKFSLSEIKNIISAQATIDNLDVDFLKDPETIINEVFYKIIDNEYIKSNQKDKLLANIKEMEEKISVEYRKKKEMEEKETELSISPSLLITATVGFMTIIITMSILMSNLFNFTSFDLFLVFPIILMIIMLISRILIKHY